MNNIRYRSCIVAVFVACGSLLSGFCDDKKPQPIITPDRENGKVYVYTGVAPSKPEGIAVPSLYMQHQIIEAGSPETLINAKTGCCLKFTVHVDQSPKWCGIVWSKAPSGEKEEFWGGTNNIPAYNLKGARKLVAYLRGERGGEQIQLKIGILGDKPYGDSLSYPIESHWFKLTTTWQKVEIKIPDASDLSKIYTPLACVVNDAHQPSGMTTVTFYIDDCYYEF